MIFAVDPFSKFVVAKAVRSATALNAVHFLVEEIILKQGCIEELVTNRGSHFLGETMHQVIKLLDLKHSMTSPYHPVLDGSAERQIGQLKQILSHYLQEDQRDWNELINSTCWAMNCAKSETTGYAPFEVIHSRIPSQLLDVMFGGNQLDSIDDPNLYTKQIQEWLDHAREIEK